MDLVATSAGPWLVLGIVVGVLLAGLLALGAVGLRRRPRTDRLPADPEPRPGDGWVVDDLPGFLDHPPGTHPPGTHPPGTHPPGTHPPGGHPETPEAAEEVRLSGSPRLLDAPRRAARSPLPPADRSDHATSRLIGVLGVAAVLLVGAAAAIAASTAASRNPTPPAASPATPSPEPTSPRSTAPEWSAPDVSGVPAQPSPGDPGAGRLAASSVPVGPDGALARGAFEGLVLERRAVGVTAAYPVVSVTASEVPGGPALAHVRLPVWNCLRDTAPADPVAAGCRRLPTQHAELGTPALTVSSDGNDLRIDGRFPTYLRPAGSAPEWTGQVYPLTITWSPEGGTLHLGTERAPAVEELTDLQLG